MGVIEDKVIWFSISRLREKYYTSCNIYHKFIIFSNKRITNEVFNYVFINY